MNRQKLSLLTFAVTLGKIDIEYFVTKMSAPVQLSLRLLRLVQILKPRS